MTHTGPIPETDGDLSTPLPTTQTCSSCKQQTVTVQIWESHDGAYVDEKFTCACGHVWWVEGPDS